MTKLYLKNIEEFFKVKITKDCVVLGADVSMYSTGLALIRTADKYLFIEKLDVIKVPHNSDNFLESVDSFLEQLDQIKRNIISKYTINRVIIEDCFFGSNVKTLKALSRFGILVYERFRGCSNECHFELPTSARRAINFKKTNKKAKGQALKKEIINYINVGFQLDLKSKDTDKADALVLALGGFCI